MLVYKIRFPLLRAAGNTGSHCNSTWFCLCGVGLLTLLEKLQSSLSRQTLPGCSSSGQAEVTPVQQVLVPQPLSSPALSQQASGCQRKLEKPCGPAGSWEAAKRAGPGWEGQTELPAPAHQLCPHQGVTAAHAKSLSVWFQESLHLCPQVWNLVNQTSEANSSL